MQNTSAPAAPAAPAPTAAQAVIAGIIADGGQIKINADGQQVVTFIGDLGTRRALAILADMYG